MSALSCAGGEEGCAAAAGVCFAIVVGEVLFAATGVEGNAFASTTGVAGTFSGAGSFVFGVSLVFASEGVVTAVVDGDDGVVGGVDELARAPARVLEGAPRAIQGE